MSLYDSGQSAEDERIATSTSTRPKQPGSRAPTQSSSSLNTAVYNVEQTRRPSTDSTRGGLLAPNTAHAQHDSPTTSTGTAILSSSPPTMLNHNSNNSSSDIASSSRLSWHSANSSNNGQNRPVASTSTGMHSSPSTQSHRHQPPPSPSQPQFPPQKSTSGSSSTSQRSPTTPNTTWGGSQAGGSRPSSATGYSTNSHATHSNTHVDAGYLQTSASATNTPRADRETQRPRDRDRPSSKRRDGNSSNEGHTRGVQVCAKCQQPMVGQFVRALGTVYHLDCFKCQDCGKVVASKFFPIDADDGSGKQMPLCETDYFRRLNLLCSKCGGALRGSYITALDMKFHVEHFTCSICPTVFGPQDSYYEHGGKVYCHFHYSTRFAVKCTGCQTAILKQFVEINRNSVDEHWHPECYMIHKFWNIKLAPSKQVKSKEIEPQSQPAMTNGREQGNDDQQQELVHEEAESKEVVAAVPDYVVQEELETPESLKDRQKAMEEQVYRIWTVLSAFEESSAACISEMLRHVSSGHYIEGVRMAEKFVLHVETLFAAIDELSAQFKLAGTKEISHVREARMLCKKVVNFFSLLSHTHATGARKMSITQELLSLVTGLAHYLKILIRIALTASLKLEREHHNKVAIGAFLSRLERLARDPEAHKIASTTATASRGHNGPATSSKSRTYGYKSLTRAVGSTLVGQGEATTDLCEGCHLTVEEECARFGTSMRWHLACLSCHKCGKVASKDRVDDGSEDNLVSLKDFRLETAASGPASVNGDTPFCSACAPEVAKEGFEYVTRLEQYAFLLCVALNKLYALLKQRGVVPSSPPQDEDESADARSLHDTYRDSTDIKRMKSVNLDRKLSTTTAKIAKRSTVVQSPSGRVAQQNDSPIPLFSGKPPVPSRKDQPIVDPIRGTTIPRSVAAASGIPAVPSVPTAARQPALEVTASPRATAMQAPQQPQLQLQPQSQQHQPQQQQQQQQQPLARPNLNRAMTAVEIVSEQPSDQHIVLRDEPGLGGDEEPTQDEEGITLADLPIVMEAEAAREQHRPIAPRTGLLLSELSALEYLIVRHVAALVLTSQTPLKELVSLDELLDMIDARKGTFWNKLFKGGKKEKLEKKKGVFGIPLESLVERNGADSMHGAGQAALRVPSFIDDVIAAMKQMDMSIEGIFRRNGNIRRLKDLSEALDRDPASVNLSEDNPVQLAALLKRFLRDLPDPLLSFKVFPLFIAAERIDDTEERKRVLHLCCCLLSKPHRDTMEALFVFLKWVASFSHVDEETGSKMDLQNLATVISPNILYSKGNNPIKDESFSAVRAVHALLEHQDEFWQVPPECFAILQDQELFSNPSQLTSKEILARAERHIGSGAARQQQHPAVLHRGQAAHPQRPDLNSAWSAPSVPGAHPSARSNQPSIRTMPTATPEQPANGFVQPQSIAGSLGPRQAPHLRSPVGSPTSSSRARLGVPAPQQQQPTHHQKSRSMYDNYHPPPPEEYLDEPAYQQHESSSQGSHSGHARHPAAVTPLQ
ncbi:Rho-type GTPase activating protein Rga1 [Microbotryomycetes sp. JL221]|nr:Rho-type GTPase activating protein Rga1 [Microbotryomycetes sp. JL221]